MEILSDIEKMDRIIKDSIINKFLKLNVEETTSYTNSDKEVCFSIVIKKATNLIKGTKFKFNIYKDKMSVSIIEHIKGGGKNTTYDVNESVEFNCEFIFSKSWFPSKQDKLIKLKANEFFEFKQNESKYNKLKHVIKNNLDIQEIRRLKLQELEKNETESTE